MEKIQQLNNLCGIDVGCTNIKMTAVVNNSCVQYSIPSGDELSREELVNAISNFYNSFNYEFDGLGIAFSGCTTDNQKVYSTTLKSLNGLSTSDFMHLQCKKIRLINDANATALAGLLEYSNARVLLGITNGTGIGVGIVINGQLFCGANGFAGEIYGNPTIGTDGNLVKTGKICSGSKILKKIKNDNMNSWKKSIINEAATYFGIELVSLIHSYNPDIIYLSGGGFSFSGYLEVVHNFVYEHAYPQFTENLKIVQTNFSNYSGCFGAMKYLLTK